MAPSSKRRSRTDRKRAGDDRARFTKRGSCHKFIYLSARHKGTSWSFTAKRKLPAGNYRLQVWHEGYGFVQRNKDDRGITIKIEDGKATEVKV